MPQPDLEHRDSLQQSQKQKENLANTGEGRKSDFQTYHILFDLNVHFQKQQQKSHNTYTEVRLYFQGSFL